MRDLARSMSSGDSPSMCKVRSPLPMDRTSSTPGQNTSNVASVVVMDRRLLPTISRRHLSDLGPSISGPPGTDHDHQYRIGISPKTHRRDEPLTRTRNHPTVG